MITFLTGLESPEKTDAFISMIKDSSHTGRHITVIVPEQQAVVWERRLARALDAKSALGLDVVSFTRLANLAQRRFGGLAYSLADKSARYLLMWRAVSEVAPLLRVYADRRNAASLVSSMQELQGELERSGVSADMLDKAADRLVAQNENSALCERLRDVALISAAYKASFSDCYDDPAEESEKLLEILRSHDLFSDGDVFIDSFYSLTATESAIVREILSQAQNVTMTFACPAKASNSSPHIAHIHKFFMRMRSFCEPKIVEITAQDGPNERFWREREHLRQNLWDFAAPPMRATLGEPYARIVSTADRYDEAEYAVCRVEELIRTGARYSDIAVIARSTEPYLGIIDTAFADAGIPLSVSTRFHLLSAPVVTLALSMIGAVRSGFARDEMVSLLRTGLTSLTEDEISSFSRYTQVWSIGSRAAYRVEEWTMNPDGYSDRLSERARRELALANSAKDKLEDMLSPLEDALAHTNGAACEPCDIRKACTALWHALERSGAYTRLGERAAVLEQLGYGEAAAFCRRSFGELTECLDTLVSVLGDEATDAAGFMSLLRSLISVRDVGVIPSGIDQVTFGAADRLRTDRISHVIILGAIDGQFPRTPSESPILTDTDRVLLEGEGIVLSENSETRTQSELFWFWRSCVSGERSLDIVIPGTDGAKKAESSPGLRRIEALLPDIPRINFSPDDALSALWSASQAPRFMNDSRECTLSGTATCGEAASSDSGVPPTSDTRNIVGDITHSALADALSMLGITPGTHARKLLWDKIDPELAEAVFGRHITTTQSRLEMYIKCAFSYYARYVLDLDERQKARVSPVDVGNFMHSVFEGYFKAGNVWDMSDSENDELIARLTGEYVENIFKDTLTPRLEYLIHRLKDSVSFLCGEMRREFRSCAFRPFAMEQPIGMGPETIASPRISLPGGRSVSLRGIIDRLDVYRQGDRTFVRVVDYKTGSKKLSDRGMALGLNTQLFLYLFAVCACPPGEFRDRLTADTRHIVPAGAMYLSARPGSAAALSDVDEAAARALASAAVVRSGKFLDDEDILRAMDSELSGDFIPVKKLKSGDFTKTAVLDTAGFETLRSQLESTVARTASSMLGGKSEALPLCYGTLPCSYCALKPLCRNVDGKCRYE